LSRLLASALAIVFQNKSNLVTFVERPNARSFKCSGEELHGATILSLREGAAQVVHANPGYSGSGKGTRPGDGEVI